MLGINVVPLNLRRQRESIPFGRRQLVCESEAAGTGVRAAARTGRRGARQPAPLLWLAPCTRAAGWTPPVRCGLHTRAEEPRCRGGSEAVQEAASRSLAAKP